ncbi:MAG: hypothetical protein JXJ17_16200 [Anaerolineae bacterium]|nr:hypothetical protein [Anaerolineae bacterium]
MFTDRFLLSVRVVDVDVLLVDEDMLRVDCWRDGLALQNLESKIEKLVAVPFGGEGV